MTLSVGEVISVAALLLGGFWALVKLIVGDKLSKINSMDAKQGEILASLAALNVRVAEVLPMREKIEKTGADVVELKVRVSDLRRDVNVAHARIRGEAK
jgi:hypothetical protein